MSQNVFDRWFSRTRRASGPRATAGRELAWANGYSLLELERAGMSEEQARRAGLQIDQARGSAVGANVIELERLRRANGW